MTTPTPRTDAAVVDWAATAEDCVYADFARQLERELTTLRELAKAVVGGTRWEPSVPVEVKDLRAELEKE